MCGIVGFIGQGDAKILENMTNALKHRGPDDSGFFIEGNVGLGHRRLSIIDLSPAGHQPMSNEDETVWITFNGEIYNFSEVKRDLVNKGHKFKSNTDTEVIIHSYEEFGDRCLEKFNGMFAFAIWDSRNRKLLLVRDRLGKKPLYYSFQKGNFVFASELKALKLYPYLDFSIDEKQIKKYFFYDYVPCPYTPWKNVFKLGPQEYLVFRDGKVELGRYWEDRPNLTVVSDNLDELKQDLDLRIKESVSKRLISDVPLGVFLSGGIDSSTVAWYAQSLTSDKIKTFSIDFREKSFGEGGFARLVSRHIGSEHYEATLSQKEALDIIGEIGGNMDEPLADASILPTYLLSRFVRKNVTVALSGDGADELFCGYQTFQAEKIYEFYRHLPDILKRIFSRASGLLPTSAEYLSLDFKLKKFVNSLEEPLLRHQNWLSSFNLKELPQLFADSDFDEEKILEDLSGFNRNLKGDGFSDIISFYQRFYMQDRVLVKVDRASMLSSLEVRSPFLDYTLVEWANSLPNHLKLKGFNPKYLLKELMRSRLPKEIIKRSKKGFSVPLGDWFRADLKNLFLSLATRQNVEKTGILNYNYISELFQEHIGSKENYGQKLWSILVFLLWQNNFYK